MKILTVLLTLLYAFAARADDVNITADKKVEWHQKEQKVVAVGNAAAVRGNMSVRAATLTGWYKNGSAEQKGRIYRVRADRDVVLDNQTTRAYGDKLDYNLDDDLAVLVGSPATIKTDKETITAEDNITYYPSAQKAVAVGNVEATDKEGNKVYSDQMTSFFKKNGTTLVMERVEMEGNLKVVTPDTTVTADRGLYLPDDGVVKLFDNVIINQQGNQLRGSEAETNLNTGVSKLLAGGKSGRVRGVFKEKKQK